MNPLRNKAVEQKSALLVLADGDTAISGANRP
jgi:hypothetical protein